MESKYEDDFINEQRIAKWLDEYFYRKINLNEYDISTKFISERPIKWGTERERVAQKQGIDIVYKIKTNEVLLVDEKAQLNYINRPLPTFAFEVLYKRQNDKNEYAEGWFVNDDLKTTHYLLIYPYSDKVRHQYEITDYRQFSEVELVLVEKNALKQKLESVGVNSDMVKEKAADMIEYDTKRVVFDIKDDRQAYLIKTQNLAEEPVNIVVRKYILDDIAVARWRVTREKIEEI